MLRRPSRNIGLLLATGLVQDVLQIHGYEQLEIGVRPYIETGGCIFDRYRKQ